MSNEFGRDPGFELADFIQAVVESWRHIETCCTYRDGSGYQWRTGDPPCPSPGLHEWFHKKEGEAWHAYRATLADERATAQLESADRLALQVTWAARESDPSAWWDAVEQAVDFFIASRSAKAYSANREGE